MEIESGDILVCTVEKIVGTTVFVEIEGIETPGTIILSEVSAGRIRNLRDYVVPKKTIVCKVLRVLNDHFELSLRRVKEIEQKKALEKSKLEKSYKKILKSILKERTEEVIQKIKETESIESFFKEAKENPTRLKSLLGKETSEKILEILMKQKEKIFSLKKDMQIVSKKPNGLTLIKNLLSENPQIEINYVAAGKYVFKSEDKELKKADKKIKDAIEKIKKSAKKGNFEFSHN